MSNARAIEAAKAFVRISADDKPLRSSLSRVPALFRSVSAGIAAVGIGNLFAQGVTKATAAVFSFAESGAQVDDMAKRTGASSESLSQLAYAAEQSGASIDDVERGMRKLGDVTTQAANGSKSASEALAAVGLSAADLEGLNPDQAMLAVAEGLSKIEDPAKRSSLAMDLLGKSGTNLLPMMEDGAAGIQKLMTEADSLGLTLTGEQAAAAAQLDDSWAKAKSTFIGTAKVIGAVLAPALSFLLETFSAVVPVMMSALKAIGEALIHWAARGWTAIQELTASFQPLFGVMKSNFTAMKNLLISGEWSKAAKFLWTTLKYEWAVGVDFLQREWQIWKKAFVDVFAEAALAARKIWGSLQNSIAHGMIEVMAFFDSTINVEEVGKTLDEDFQRRMDSAQKESDAAAAEREKQFANSIGKASTDLQQAKAEWEAAVKEAATIAERKANEPNAAEIADDRFTKLMEDLKAGEIATRIEGAVKGPGDVGDLRTVGGAGQLTSIINAQGNVSRQQLSMLQEIKRITARQLVIAERGPGVVKV
jgi:hypothetical protein